MRTRAEVGSSKWFGEIPDGWKMVPTSRAFSIAKGATITKADLVENGTPVVNYGQVHSKANSGTHLSKQLVRHVPDGFLPDGLTPAPLGSFIFASTSEDLAGCGACVYNDTENIVWPGGDTCVLTPEASTENKYFAYLFATDVWRFQIRRDLVDVKVFHVNKGNLNDTYVVVPPNNEQRRIVSFLDGACEIIDADIAKRRKVIEKLGEYKKSVITRAVTKGLEPDVEMKDSEVEWIGAVPVSWRVTKGKYVYSLLSRPVCDSDEVITCFRDGEVTLRSNRRDEGFTFADKEVGYQGIEPGDLVVHGMDGFAGSIGISDSRGKATPVLRALDSGQNKRYLMYLLRSYAYLRVYLSIADGIRVRSCNLSWKKLAELDVILPPLSEQQRIVAFLDERCAAIDEAISRQKQLIGKLEEYRKSLIHHAVTGKIDCREA